MKSKKFLAVILAVMLLVSMFLVGCNRDGAGGDAGADGGIKIGFSISERDQFLSTLEDAVTAAAKEKGDVDITVFDAEADVQKQLDHVTTFAAQKFDAIIVNIVDSTVAEGILKAAGDIPVVFVNRLPDEQYLIEGKSAFVGSDEKDSGGLQAKFLSELFADKEPKELSYVMFMGTLGTPHAQARTESAKSGLEAAGFTINKVMEDSADFDRATAMEKMQQFLGTGKEFDVVICNNDEMALGVIEALRAVGAQDVPVVGIDATPSAIEALEKGELACTIFQDAAGQGTGAVEVAYKAAKGEAFETHNWVPFELVTKENVSDFK